MKALKQLNSHQWLLLLIIAVGTFLRFYKLWDMPFMHDEFSALFRTRFSDFSDLINTGVRIGDTHPAGVQVFLWWYVSLVGENEFLLKLPFVFMGIAAIPLSYWVGKKWFNKNVGLLVAVFIATTQYTLTYSVIIRPYISGLFLSLAMVYFWTNLVFNNQFRWKNWVGYILFSALSAYNHHFSLLFAFIVGGTGIFVVPKKQMVKYIFAGVLIFALYIPHLSIFFDQLGQGGLSGWLRKPTLYFILNYVKYIFHFSPFIYVVVAFTFMQALLFSYSKKQSVFYKISIVWFLLPLVIGLGYSIFVSPVIQYSMLLFSFPYFLFVVFGLFPKAFSQRFFTLLVLLMLSLNVFTLFKERQHYKVLHETTFYQFLKDINELKQTAEAEILIANHSQINNYYQEKFNWTFDYKNVIVSELEKIQLDSVQQIVLESNQPYFIYGGVSYVNPTITQIIKEKFPYCILKKDYRASNLYVFSKKAEKDLMEPIFKEYYNFRTSKSSWNNTENLVITKSATELLSNQEWGPTFKLKLDTLLTHKNNAIDIHFNFKKESADEVLIVTEIKQKGKVIDWSATSSANFINNKGAISVFKTVELSGLNCGNKNIELVTYIWNKNKVNVKLNNASISIRKGNPIQYALYEPILNNYE